MGSKRIKVYLLIGVVFIMAALAAYQLIKTTEQYFSDAGAPEIEDPYLREGQRLSVVHCSSCHLYPSPDLLPKRTWRFETLPAMAEFLGIDQFTGEPIQHQTRTNPYVPNGLYPAEAQVTAEEWHKIQDYYWYASPEELLFPVQEKQITKNSQIFTIHIPEEMPSSDPVITMVKYDEVNQVLYVSNSTDLQLHLFDEALNRIFSTLVESPVSHILFQDDRNTVTNREILATLIGDLYPSDAPYGAVTSGYWDSENQQVIFERTETSGLTRPVQSTLTDLTGSGNNDLLINEFGHRGGSLSLHIDFGSDHENKKKLIDTPGCIQSEVLDYTGNGLMDIVTLCTQYDQSIYLLENKGDGEFEKSILKQFEITAGSSSFEIYDFNRNGLPDILYTSGDNADYSQVFKPYHGVYIFLNQGDHTFEEAWFYPLNGAYNAKARDFSGNGHPDIAVISFFADFENTPEEGFVFFKNEGDLTFTPYHHPETSIGRWLTMDVADWNGNGRYDIILGNSSVGPFGPSMLSEELQEKWKQGPYFIVLENQME